jgi:hypothetical protein
MGLKTIVASPLPLEILASLPETQRQSFTNGNASNAETISANVWNKNCACRLSWIEALSDWQEIPLLRLDNYVHSKNDTGFCGRHTRLHRGDGPLESQ